jgi:hypothetical protein
MYEIQVAVRNTVIYSSCLKKIFALEYRNMEHEPNFDTNISTAK